MKGGDNKEDKSKGNESALDSQDYDNIFSIPFKVKRR
jgi:hypothetical protein